MIKVLCAGILCLIAGCFSFAGAQSVDIPEDSWVWKSAQGLLWDNDHYRLDIDEEDGKIDISVMMFDQASTRYDVYDFTGKYLPETDSLLAFEYTHDLRYYDEDNRLVRELIQEGNCETGFFLNEEGKTEIRNAPDSRLEGRAFQSNRWDEEEEISLAPEENWWFEDDEIYFALEKDWWDADVYFAPEKDWWDLDVYFEKWGSFRQVLLENNTWFVICELPGDVYALYEPRQEQTVISYLIPGKERALLWDTGMGVADIRECVERLTDLPVIVLNSHEHFDHTGGNYLFDQVMCYNAASAIRALTEGMTHEELMQVAGPDTFVELPENFSLEGYCRIGKAPTDTVEDGQVIDLGGRKLEVMYTPGHSDASIMLIDEENSILFTGDTWYPSELYAFFENSSLRDYVKSMRRAVEVIRDRGIRRIYGSHNEVQPGTELFVKTADFLEDVLNGKVEGQMEDGLMVYVMDESICLVTDLPGD